MVGQGPAHILVVDDEDMIRITLEAMLRRCGYTVHTAADGAAALALMQQHIFDLLLLDLKMPGLSGLDIAQVAHAQHPQTAILILTGSSPLDGSDDERLLAPFPFMIKTASPQEVLARVARLLAS